MKITKEQVLANIEEVKKYISEAEQEKTEEKVVGIAIKNRWTGEIIFQSTKTTYKEAITEKGGVDLSGVDLSGANLCNADLCNANLCNADLRNANLCNADLCNADLCNADLCNADLRNANLCNADLRNANLRNANLSNANLSGAELNRALFYGRGGTVKLKRSQLPDFLGALGFVIIED